MKILLNVKNILIVDNRTYQMMFANVFCCTTIVIDQKKTKDLVQYVMIIVKIMHKVKESMTSK